MNRKEEDEDEEAEEEDVEKENDEDEINNLQVIYFGYYEVRKSH